MEAILALYARPYDPHHPLVCLDQISKVLRSTPRGGLPARPGHSALEDYEYARPGSCALFLAVEALRGFRYVWVRARRTYHDCAEVLRDLVDVLYPDAEWVDLVLDNLNIHHPACLYERFAPAEARRIAARLRWHYTPVHASWLNIAECELSVLRRQALAGRLPDQAAVAQRAHDWQSHRNQQQVGVHWRFTTDDARIKLKHLYPQVILQNSP